MQAASRQYGGDKFCDFYDARKADETGRIGWEVSLMISLLFLNKGATRAKSQRKKFDSNRVWRQVKLLSIEHPKTTEPREQHRPGTQTQFLFTLRFFATQFDAIKQ